MNIQAGQITDWMIAAWIWMIAACIQPGLVLAATGAERLAGQIAALRPDLALLVAQQQALCNGDALCLAQKLALARPALFRLLPVDHPDTDRIRWVKSNPSISIDGRTIAILGFGRKVVRELQEAIGQAGPGPVEIDLTQNLGGDFARMRKVEALLAGLVEQGSDRQPAIIRHIRVSPRTASAGLWLAHLLHIRGLYLCGDGMSAERPERKAVLSAHHDWRLIVVIDAFGHDRLESEPLQPCIEPVL